MKTGILFYRHYSVLSILIAILLGFTTCKKERTGEPQQQEVFTAKAAKEWYYGTFKKSPEWQQSIVKGKQLPVWKYGNYRKVGNMEIVEFPLQKQSVSFSILSEGLTSGERNTVFNGSLSKIVFIKTAGGEVVVREVDYIPDYQYLKQKGYDISAIALGIKGNDYTGRLVIKKWGGEKLHVIKMEAGNIVAKGKMQLLSTINRQNTSSRCTVIITCDVIQSCTFYLEGDVWISSDVCSEPWLGNCYGETYGCGDGHDDIPGDAECNFGSNESCECQLYGIGCGNGNGGSGGGEQPSDIIINLIENPCIQQTLSSMNSQNGVTTYYHTLVDVFDATDNLNLILTDYDGGASDTTFGNSQLLPSGTSQINLNLNTLSDCSSEFIASTILHEMIHSYLSTHPMNWDTTLTDHQYMVSQLLDKMAQSLIGIFPSLSEYDAYCMAYVGFGQKESDPIQQQNLDKFLKMARDKIADKFNILNESYIYETGYGYTHKGTSGTRSGACQ